MTAKEMFEELGYELYENRAGYPWIDFESEDFIITFFLKSKSYKKVSREDENLEKNINQQEYKAITQKMKELGWLENETN